MSIKFAQKSPQNLDLHLDLLPFLVIFDSQPLDARGFQAEIYALLAEDGRPSKAPDTAESAYDEAGEASPEPPMPPAPWRKTNGGWKSGMRYLHICTHTYIYIIIIIIIIIIIVVIHI